MGTIVVIGLGVTAIALTNAKASPLVWIAAGLIGLGAVMAVWFYDSHHGSVVLTYTGEDGPAAPFKTLQEAFEELTGAGRVREIVLDEATEDLKRNAGASHSLTAHQVRPAFELPRGVTSNVIPLHLGLASSDLYFFPDRVLVFASVQAGEILYSAISAQTDQRRFVERETVPSDALVVDRTWQRVNRDGGPDRRFHNNAEIPVAMYAELALTSPLGPIVRLQISDLKVAPALANAFRGMAATDTSAQTTSSPVRSAAPQTAAKPQEPVSASPSKGLKQGLAGEALQLAKEKLPGWRGLLFAKVLEDAITVESEIANTSGLGGKTRPLSNQAALSELQAILGEAESCFPRMTAIANAAFEHAPGDAEGLPQVEAGRSLGLEYAGLAALQSRALSLGANPHFGVVASELARALKGPAIEVAELPARLRTALQARLAEANDRSPVDVDLKLVFKIDNEAALLAAVREAGRTVQDSR